jgi:hypothetical protein
MYVHEAVQILSPLDDSANKHGDAQPPQVKEDRKRRSQSGEISQARDNSQ